MKNEILFFDSSALLKRYLNEEGSETVLELFKKSKEIFVAPITHIECVSAFRRLLHTKEIDRQTFQRLCDEVALDFISYVTVEFNDHLESKALNMLNEYPLKASDTIQLASALMMINEINSFVVSDIQLKNYAHQEGFHIIDPTS